MELRTKNKLIVAVSFIWALFNSLNLIVFGYPYAAPLFFLASFIPGGMLMAKINKWDYPEWIKNYKKK